MSEPPRSEGLSRVRAPTIRSRLVLEVAAELVSQVDQPLRQARVLLREQAGETGWPVTLDSSSAIEGIANVAAGRSTLAMINPAALLTLAYRGKGAWTAPQPVRALCVIPSRDFYACAVTRETGLTRFEDIAERRYPLKISVRKQRDHSLHLILEHLAAAAGFTVDDLTAWGGELRYDGQPREPKSAALARGADAVFDEAVQSWLLKVVDEGMAILTMAESTMLKLEAMGYRRAVIEKARYPNLPADVVTLDFSGWAVFVHADAPDALIARICTALEARKDRIPWDGEGPLPLERMCRDTPDTPLDVPLHPAAERFWKERGYLG